MFGSATKARGLIGRSLTANTAPSVTARVFSVGAPFPPCRHQTLPSNLVLARLRDLSGTAVETRVGSVFAILLSVCQVAALHKRAGGLQVASSTESAPSPHRVRCWCLCPFSHLALHIGSCGRFTSQVLKQAPSSVCLSRRPEQATSSWNFEAGWPIDFLLQLACWASKERCHLACPLCAVPMGMGYIVATLSEPLMTMVRPEAHLISPVYPVAEYPPTVVTVPGYQKPEYPQAIRTVTEGALCARGLANGGEREIGRLARPWPGPQVLFKPGVFSPCMPAAYWG